MHSPVLRAADLAIAGPIRFIPSAYRISCLRAESQREVWGLGSGLACAVRRGRVSGVWPGAVRAHRTVECQCVLRFLALRR